jgi:hypothetical protein
MRLVRRCRGSRRLGLCGSASTYRSTQASQSLPAVIIQVQSAESQCEWRRASGGKTRGTGTRVRTPLCPRPRWPATAGLHPSIPGILLYLQRHPHIPSPIPRPFCTKIAARPVPRERARHCLRPVRSQPAARRADLQLHIRGQQRRAGRPPALRPQVEVRPRRPRERRPRPRRRVRGPRERAAAVAQVQGGRRARPAPLRAASARPRTIRTRCVLPLLSRSCRGAHRPGT